jgi:histone H3/H4
VSELPLAPFKRIIKQEGAKRVSEEAAETLRNEIEEHARQRAVESRKYAEHADRKTVQAEDVEASS